MQMYEDVWLKVKDQLKNYYDADVYSEYFQDINHVFKVVNNYIYLIVPNELVKKRIETLYLNRLNSMIKESFNELHMFKLITQEKSELETKNTNEYQITKPEDLSNKYRNDLNNSYTFDNFVVGDSNRLAYLSAMNVAKQPTGVINPLYIFGDVGLGKTHLMQCIGNYVLDVNMHKKILYIKTDQFVEEYGKSIHQNLYNEFTKKFEDVDIFLVDDIQFLSGKEKSQLEFFKVFEKLYSTQKQIIITSDRKASELHEIMSRLTSRFEWGLVVDIDRPNLTLRKQILKQKLATEISDPSVVPEEIIDCIAGLFENNVRELEGALKRVLFYCTAFNVEFTVENTMIALENLIKVKVPHTYVDESNVTNILSIVSNYFNITTTDLLGKSRSKNYVYPRQIAMYILKDMFDLTYKAIGNIFGGRDHTTVLYSIERIETDMQMDKNRKLDVENLLIKCGKIKKK